MAAKRLGLLRELVPAATRFAALINPANAAIAETTLREVESAARAMGLQIQVFHASTSREIDAAFATLCASGRMPFSSAAIPSLTLVVSSWPFWQCATRSPRRIWVVNMSKPAG